MPHLDNLILERILYILGAVVLVYLGYRIGRTLGILAASRLISQKEQELFTAQKGFKTQSVVTILGDGGCAFEDCVLTLAEPLGCALTVAVYYHLQGIKEQGVVSYVKHFAAPPGAPIFLAPIMLPIEIISHLSRVLSLSLRLFGNIFGEELVILILFSIIPFFVPLPMMFLGLITASLQAFIFVLLTTIYLGGAVATEHEQHDHGEMVAGEV